MFIHLLLHSSFALADCDPPMGLRSMLPDNATDVPINTHIFVSLIGNGDASHFNLELRRQGAPQPISGQSNTACYIHESDTEFHCNIEFEPDSNLAPNTDYVIRLVGTSSHQVPGTTLQSMFTTGTATVNTTHTAPSLTIGDYGIRDDDGIGECDWPDAYRYNLNVTLAAPDPTHRSLIHIFEVDSNGVETIVHSLFVPPTELQMDFRQVLQPGTEGDKCYRVSFADIAGNQSDLSDVICSNDPPEEEDTGEQTDTGDDEPIEDTAVMDTAIEEDTSIEEPQPDTAVEVPQDTSEPDDVENGQDRQPQSPKVTVEQGGGCNTAVGSSGILIVALVLLGRIRQRIS